MNSLLQPMTTPSPYRPRLPERARKARPVGMAVVVQFILLPCRWNNRPKPRHVLARGHRVPWVPIKGHLLWRIKGASTLLLRRRDWEMHSFNLLSDHRQTFAH